MTFHVLFGLTLFVQAPDKDTSLLDMAQLALPGVNLDVLTPPEGLPGLANIFLDRLLVDVSNKEFCVEARVAGITFEVIPSLLSLQNIEFGLCLSKRAGRTNYQLGIGGEIIIGATTARAMLDSKPGLLTVSASVPGRMTIVDILTSFGVSFIPGGDSLTDILRGNGFDSFAMVNTAIEVNRRGSQATLHLTATASLPGLTAEIEVLFTGLGTPQKTACAVFSTPEIQISNIVNKVSGIDLEGIPVLEDLTVPNMAITLCNGNLQLPTGIQFRSTLVRGRSFAKGIVTNYLQEIAGELRNFQLNFRPGSFDINLEDLPTVTEALQLLIPDVISTDAFTTLPSLVPGVGGLRVTRIAYTQDTGRFKVEATLRDVTIIPDLLEIKDAMLSVSYTKSQKSSSARLTPAQRKSQTSVAISGDADLFSLTLRMEISFDTARKAFGIRLTTPSGTIGLGKLFDLLGSAANDLTNPAISALRLRDSSITNALFDVNTQSKAVAFPDPWNTHHFWIWHLHSRSHCQYETTPVHFDYECTAIQHWQAY